MKSRVFPTFFLKKLPLYSIIIYTKRQGGLTISDISKIDKNFEVKTNIGKEDIKFYDAESEPFKIYGLIKENGKFRRLPESVAKSISGMVCVLSTNTSGGRVKFVTDSSYVVVKAMMDGLGKSAHFAFTGSIGFDLYVGNEYVKTFIPPVIATDGFENIIEFGTKEMRDITINFPLYSNVNTLYIGLEEDAKIEKAKPYTHEKPIVFYGSSITQGGCASRPGRCYESIVSRRFDTDFINLGFSGNAFAEDEITDYIKELDMSVFVMDYDHNAPTLEHLEKTHEKMFKSIREQNPDLPIIMMSRPRFYLIDDEEKRREVIERTYKNAVLSGDKNVYFIDGKALTELCGNEGTVDGVHPTDFGFASMAEALCKVIEKIDF